MMRRYSLTRLILAIAATLVASLSVATGAQAIVVNDNGTHYGIAPLPGTNLPATVPAVTTGGACNDPLLAPDLTWQTTGIVSPLCYHDGSVLPSNETYVL